MEKENYRPDPFTVWRKKKKKENVNTHENLRYVYRYDNLEGKI